MTGKGKFPMAPFFGRWTPEYNGGGDLYLFMSLDVIPTHEKLFFSLRAREEKLVYFLAIARMKSPVQLPRTKERGYSQSIKQYVSSSDSDLPLACKGRRGMLFNRTLLLLS